MNHSVTMNEDRIQERAQLGFYRSMWDTYKGHVRGMFSGIAIGGMTGAAIGLAVSFFAPVALTASIIIPAFASVGALFGADQFGAAGAAAASRASGLAEKHARLLDPAHGGDRLAELDDQLMTDGRGHHYEFPQGRDKGKFFVWKSGAVGAGVGALVGALLGAVGHSLPFINIGTSAVTAAVSNATVSSIGIGLALPGGILGMAVIGALTLGIIGLTFGIERSVFKSIFNQTDANIQGKLAHGFGGPDLGREQTLGKESDYALSQHRLRRQAEITGLEKQYNEKILHGGMSGLFRGLAGGVATGTVIGALSGIFAFGLACLPVLVGAAALPGLPLLGTLTVCFAGVGALLGMEVFTQAGMEAGAETTARAIDNEFGRNRELRARGLTPPIQPKPEKEWFNWNKALTATLLGAAIGVIIAPVILPAGLGGTLLSIGLLPATSGMGLGTMFATGGIAGGMMGMTYGIGNSVWHAITKATDWIYDRSYFGDKEAQPDMQVARSKLQEMAAPAPLYGNVTPEETALLNQRLNTDKNFSQTITTQQTQAAPASLGV